MTLKSETRVLFIHSIKSSKNNIKLKFYAIIRGNKGLEHLGMVENDVKDVIESLRRKGILDEVRVIVNLDSVTSLQRQPSSIRPEWTSHVLKIFDILEKEVVRLIGM